MIDQLFGGAKRGTCEQGETFAISRGDRLDRLGKKFKEESRILNYFSKRSRRSPLFWCPKYGFDPPEKFRLGRHNPSTDHPETRDLKTSDPETRDLKTSDPKTRDPKTSDPKTRDPKISDPKEAEVQEAGVQEARVQEAGVQEARVQEARFQEVGIQKART